MVRFFAVIEVVENVKKLYYASLLTHDLFT